MTTRNLSSLRGYWTIVKKEVVDNVRDRRTLTTMAISIVVGPLLLLGFIWFAEKTFKDETDLINAEPVTLPVIGAEHAPNLIGWLEQNNVVIVDPPENIQRAIKNKQYQMVLEIGDDYPQLFSSGKTAPVRLIHDSSVSKFEQIDYQKVKSAINRYSGQIGALRLTARGVSPEVIRAIHVNVSDVAKPQARGAQILTMLPYLIIIFIMVGGMYLAIDTTAGEREKGSLEPLLTQPVSRRVVLLAKLSATAVFSALTLLLVLAGLAVSFNYMPIDSISFSITASAVIKVFVTCLPFVFVGCAFMILIASFTKSYKEAQSYLGMVMLVPSIPLMLLMFMSPLPGINNMWIPSLSQALIIIETFKGESIAASLIALSMVSSMMLAAAFSFIAIKLYQRERILG